MRMKSIIVVGTLALIAGGVGCGNKQGNQQGAATQPGQTYGTNVPGQAQSDQALYEQIQKAVASQPGITTPQNQYQIKVDNGQVTLTGTVASAADHEKILSAAQLAAGKSNVTDELKVEGAGQPAQPAPSGQQAPGPQPAPSGQAPAQQPGQSGQSAPSGQQQQQTPGGADGGTGQ